MVLVMQNTVPAPEAVLAERALAGRREQYETEVRRLIDAAFEVMGGSGDIDPQVRDIVKTAGLSNQAFYRHFASKDALMLAVLADGQRQLVDYLARKIAAANEPEAQLHAWVEGVMAQARNTDAADRTRPFAVNGPRLADRFPDELLSSRAALIETLAPTVVALGGNDHDATLICELALARMNDAIAHRRKPSRDEIESLYAFCLGGIANGT
jgi:AcrR family transcriptional regulator